MTLSLPSFIYLASGRHYILNMIPKRFWMTRREGWLDAWIDGLTCTFECQLLFTYMNQ